MPCADELALLHEQLDEAIRHPEVEAWEIPAMAGLIQRLAPDDPMLLLASASVPAELDFVSLASETLDQLRAIEEDDDETESWDALCMLDELCAAATFLDCASTVQPMVEQAVACIRAFPEAWVAHVDPATMVLLERAPRPGDPAQHLWEAVRAAGSPETRALMEH